MGKEENFGDKKNSNGFDKRPQDATKGGRKPSIRKQLEATLENEGGLTVPAKQVTKIHDDGSVTIKLPTSEQMALKLVSWAMSGKGNDSIKAIQMIMEQIDGKPKQTIEQSTEHTFVPKEVREQRIDQLLKKRNAE